MDAAIFEFLTALTGRSALLDFLIEQMATNELLKAGVMGACLVIAWATAPPNLLRGVRRKLILVACAALCTVAATKVLGKLISIPRPYVLAEKAYRFEGDRLRPYEPMRFTTPLTPAGAERRQNLESGFIPGNDWESFPSDHAGFFGALAFGLLWVNRRLGSIALAWTLLVILPGKLLRGFHAPSDLAAGLALALLVVLLFRWFEKLPPLNWLAGQTLRFNALATGLFFAFAMEVTCTLEHVQDAALAARDLMRGI